MNQYLLYAQSLCDPVLRNAEAVHAEYLEVDAQLCCGAKVGYVGVHCSSCAANGLSDICGAEVGVITVCASCRVSCLVFCQLYHPLDYLTMSAFNIRCWTFDVGRSLVHPAQK